MKRVILLFLLITFLHAQQNKKLNFGITTQVNSRFLTYSITDGNKVKNYISPLLYYNFGLYAQYPLSKKLNIKGILGLPGFSPTSISINNNYLTGTISINQEIIPYLTFTTNLEYNLFKIKNSTFFIGIGAGLQYFINNKGLTQIKTENITYTKLVYNNLTYTTEFSLGFKFKTKRGRILELGLVGNYSPNLFYRSSYSNGNSYSVVSGNGNYIGLRIGLTF